MQSKKCGEVNSSVGEERQALITSKQTESTDKMKPLFGFNVSDILSFNKFVSLLYTPKDPSSLGYLRIVFGMHNST